MPLKQDLVVQSPTESGLSIDQKFERWKKDAFCTEACQKDFALELLYEDGLGEMVLDGLGRQNTAKSRS